MIEMCKNSLLANLIFNVNYYSGGKISIVDVNVINNQDTLEL